MNKAVSANVENVNQKFLKFSKDCLQLLIDHFSMSKNKIMVYMIEDRHRRKCIGRVCGWAGVWVGGINWIMCEWPTHLMIALIAASEKKN